MPHLRASSLAVALAATALLLASCGGSDAKLLPGETAREITANLDTVQQLSAEGDCAGAESAVQQVGEQIEALEGVDAKLKRALEAGAVRLNEVISSCEESPTEAVAPAIAPTETEGDEEEAPPGQEKKGEEKGKEKGNGKGKEEEPAPEAPSPPPALPPQANGEGKGLENGQGPPSGEEGEGESGSGGVAPGAPAGEGE